MPPSNRRAVVVGALVAASWANVALLDTWLGLFHPDRVSAMGGRPSAEAYWTAVLIVLIAAVVGAAAASIRGKIPLRIWLPINDILLLAALLSLSATLWRVNGGMLTTFNTIFRSLGRSELYGVGVATLIVGLFVIRYWRACMRAGQLFLLYLSPFLLVTLARASIATYRVDFEKLDQTVISRGIAERQPGPRVIIVVFDELDYTLAFPARPERIQLPTFDKLRSESVFTTDATPPAQATNSSLPSYILGQPSTSIAGQQAAEALQSGPGMAADSATGESTIFHDAARLGASSELVGYYLPYCRWSFAALLELCTSLPFTWGGVFDGPVGIGRSLVRQVLALVVVGNRRAQIARLEGLTAASERAVSDSSRRLVFLHLPVPHFPPIWDARLGRYTVMQTSPGAYFDNLELADRILARLRAAVERGATAQPTFLIVTSDHPWRSGPIDGRVGGKIPFLLRTPSAEGIEVHNQFNAVRLRALTAELLGGKLTTGREIAAWMASSAGE